MKKVATLTFHWATNYGAILQAYSLQRFIEESGYSTEIIDYRPQKIVLKQNLKRIIRLDIDEIIKEHNLKKFRKERLVLSRKRYFNNRQLRNDSNEYKTIIAGSDQIWNEGFVYNAEKGITLSYFLDFAKTNQRRIGYAVSFGKEDITDNFKDIVSDEISKFYAVGVREYSGKTIMSRFDKKAELVCDPTLLLEREAYEHLLDGKAFQVTDVYSYIIHKHHDLGIRVSNYIKGKYSDDVLDYSPRYGMYEWLYNIKYSKLVVTNSFHGVMMSLILNTPFVVVLIEESGMNDRIVTLLKMVGLENRIITSYNKNVIDDVCETTIIWSDVNIALQKYRKQSQKFLLDKIN